MQIEAPALVGDVSRRRPSPAAAKIDLWRGLLHAFTEFFCTDALAAYQHGFAYNVMRTPDDDGVMLEDVVLIEDGAPGAGASEKGTWTEEICEGVLARKTILLDDPTALEAHLVLYMTAKSEDKRKQQPFFVVVNG